MADAVDIEHPPRKANSITLTRKNKKYTAKWKLPSNATSNQRNDRTERQYYRWQYVLDKKQASSKAKPKDSQLITKNWIQKSTSVTSSTLNMGSKSSSIVKNRKKFYPIKSHSTTLKTYNYSTGYYVTNAWKKKHENEKAYVFKKASKKNANGYQWYYITEAGKKKFVSDETYARCKGEPKYVFESVSELLAALPTPNKRSSKQKTLADEYNKAIKDGKPWLAKTVESITRGYNQKLYSIRFVVVGNNTKGDGEYAYKDYVFQKPAKPKVSVTFDDDANHFVIKITSTNKERKERYDTLYTIDITETNLPKTQGVVSEKNHITGTFTKKEFTKTIHVNTANVPIGSSIKVSVSAVSRGFAGDASASASHTFTHGEEPVIKSISAVLNYKGKNVNIADDVNASEYTAQVIVKLKKAIGGKGVEVGLKRIIVDDPTGTAYDSETKVMTSSPETWDLVQKKVGTDDKDKYLTFGESVADVLAVLATRQNGRPYGQRVWYIIYTLKNGLYRWSKPKQATMFYRETPTFESEELDFLNVVSGDDGESVHLYLAWDQSKYETGYTDDQGQHVEPTVTEKDTSNEISWSDKEYAWISNEEPSTFDMTWGLKSNTDEGENLISESGESTSRKRVGEVYISGLTEGTPYWFKGRRHLKMDDIDSYSDYFAWANNPVTPVSKPKSVSLSVPDIFVFGKDLRAGWTFDSESAQKRWGLMAKYEAPEFWYTNHPLSLNQIELWAPGSRTDISYGAYLNLTMVASESPELAVISVTAMSLTFKNASNSSVSLSLYNNSQELGSDLSMMLKIGPHDPVDFDYELEEAVDRTATIDLVNSTDNDDDDLFGGVSLDELVFSMNKKETSIPVSITFEISGRLAYSTSDTTGGAFVLEEVTKTVSTNVTIPKSGAGRGMDGTIYQATYASVEGLIASGGSIEEPDSSDSYTIDYDTLFSESFMKVVQNGTEVYYGGPSIASGSTFQLKALVSTGGLDQESEWETVTMAYPPECDVWIPDVVTDCPISLIYFSSDPEASAIISISSMGMTRETPDGEETQAEGDYVWSASVNSSNLLASSEITSENADVVGKKQRFAYAHVISLEDDLDLWDGCSYKVSIRNSNDDTGLSSETVECEFTVDWAHKATAPSVYSTAIAYPNSENVKYVELVARMPEIPTNYAGDVVDIYRVTPDGAHLIYSGAQFEQKIYDKFPPFSKVANLRYIFCTRAYNGDIAWLEVPYSVRRHGLRFDWGKGRYLELPYNIQLKDKFEKQSEIRTHIDGKRNLYSNGAVKRTAGLNAEIIKLLEPEQQELIREMAQYPGPIMVRAHDGTAYAANVNVSGIDNQYSNLVIPITIDTEEIDMVEEYMAVANLN